ncbi:MAG: hypothetical protein ACRD1E_09990, partial [Terriglobales bacterium]
QVLRLPRAGWWVGACAVLLLASWFWNPPYPFPFEDNLAYVQFVRLHQAAAAALEAAPPPGPVWTAWPATDELSRPELGYVAQALPVRALEDFSPASLAGVSASGARAARVLYLYSRQFQPRRDLSRSLPFWSRWAERFFGDAPQAPAAWLARFGLQPSFVRASSGQWVMLARRPRAGDQLGLQIHGGGGGEGVGVGNAAAAALTRSAALPPGPAWRP